MSGTRAKSSPKEDIRQTSLWELAGLFLKLGTIAFGGPAAHIAMMEDEVVRRRRWLSREKFLDLLGATNLIPGPNSTELAIHIGHQQAGWPGLLVAGCSFILPAALIVTAFAWAYVRYGSLPQVGHILYGVKPVIIAIVLQALWGLGRSAAKTKFLALVGLVAVILSFLRVHELLVLFLAGVVVVLSRWISDGKRKKPALSLLPTFSLFQTTLSAGAVAAPVGLWPLFLFFLKVGSVLFGSGYVLLAFLRADLVDRWHWLTNAQLLDAIAVGQVTHHWLPAWRATRSGSRHSGHIPSRFCLRCDQRPLIPRIRRSPTAGAFLDGVNVGSLALMVVVTFALGKTALIDFTTIILAVVSALLLMRYRVNSLWLVLGGALAGLIL